MDLKNISSWSIRNPIPPLMLVFILTVLGLVSFFQMKITQNPDISTPMAQIIVSQPGGAPTELETQVTQKIEGAVAGIGNVKSITSMVQEGSSFTSVEFHIGTPVDRAINDVRDAVSNIRSELPEGILEPVVKRIDIDGGAIAYVAVKSTAMTLEQLSWFVDNTLTKRLVSVAGVAQVSRSGGVSREIRIDLDPVRLQSHGITAAQVNTQLRQMNLDAPGGRTEIAGAEQSVRVLGGARTALELGETRIALAGGRDVRLSDIANVTDGTEEQRSLARLDGRQVTSFGLFKAKGASDVQVYDDMHKVMDQLQEEFPDISFTELYTSVDYTRLEYHSAMTALVEGALLAVLVVWLFLRDWRATVISALAIPLSAIPTFWFMDMMGFTLNSISLLALALVAGILVDDAIVEIENIVRHMKMGKSPYQASMDAADEIGMAVVATSLSIIAVFMPVSFMPGIVGQFFKQFGLTVSISVFMSLVIARTLTPLMAAYFLSADGHHEPKESWLMSRYLRFLHWTVHRHPSRPSRNFRQRIWNAFRVRSHQLLMGGIGLLCLVLTVVLMGSMPQTFAPSPDIGTSIVQVEMAPGSTLQDTARAVDHITAILKQQPEISSQYEDIGDGGDVRKATIFAQLVPPGDREVTTKEFEQRIMPKFADVPDARIFFQAVGPTGGSRDVVIMMAGDDPVLLEDTVHKLEREMQGMKMLRGARIDGDMDRPEILIRPRFDMAAQMGVSVAALSQTIRIATIGDIEQNLAKFSLSDRQVPIRVSLQQNSRADADMLANLPVPTTSGGTVPLKLVADISFGKGPVVIRRYNQTRRITLVADLNGVQSGTALKAIGELPTMKNLPAGVRQVKFGEAEVMDDLISGFVMAVTAGILLVFTVLVLLYKRLLSPFVNMGSLLLAPLGAIIALILTGHPLSMPVFIGILMLLGIVAKNSILLVDFAIEEMRAGVDRETAIVDAGRKRAQPIIMTTVAMSAGMIPVAIGLHGDSSFRAPMGIAVMGGLILSTALTLVIVPAAFTLADDLEQKIGPILKRLFTTGGASTPAPQAPGPHAAE